MPAIDHIIDTIRDREDHRETIASAIRTEASQEPILATTTAYEDELFHDCKPARLDNTTITGVDGGLFQKAYHGVDIIAARALAARFTFRQGTVEDVTYHPTKRPALNYADIGPIHDTQTFQRQGTLHRLAEEIGQCNAIIEETDLLLLDGAIVPQYMDKPPRDVPAYDRYTDLLDQYRDLLQTASPTHQVAGVIEDSRSTSMTERLAGTIDLDQADQQILENSPDTTILAYAMEQGERTAVIPYADETQDHPILSDLALDTELYSFYLKTVERDRPVRIDFTADDDPIERAETIAAQILPLCQYSSTYGIPSVVVEADQRAKIDEEEIEQFEAKFRSALGPMSGVQDLRRNNRPF